MFSFSSFRVIGLTNINFFIDIICNNIDIFFHYFSLLYKKYLRENDFNNIEFLYNNAYLVENKIIVGTRGWINSWRSQENYKILKRENDRLKLSIEDGIKKYGNTKEMVAFIHYPPFYKEVVPEEIDFIKTLNKFNIKKCYYAHLHGESHREAIEGNINGIEFKLVSSDYLKFDLIEI